MNNISLVAVVKDKKNKSVGNMMMLVKSANEKLPLTVIPTELIAFNSVETLDCSIHEMMVIGRKPLVCHCHY